MEKRHREIEDDSRPSWDKRGWDAERWSRKQSSETPILQHCGASFSSLGALLSHLPKTWIGKSQTSLRSESILGDRRGWSKGFTQAESQAHWQSFRFIPAAEELEMIFSEPPPSQCRWSRQHLRSKDYTGSSCSSSSAFRLQWPRSWPWPHTLHIVELQQRMQRKDFKGGCREEVFGDVYGGRIQILGRCGWVEEREREIYKIPDLNITFSQNIFNTNKRNWDGQLLRPLWSFYLFLFVFFSLQKLNIILAALLPLMQKTEST